MELSRSPTDHNDWADIARTANCCCTNQRCHRLWKRRGLEKSKTPLSHPAWKSRKLRGIPTFPQPRRRLVNFKTGHIVCYKNRTSCFHCTEHALQCPAYSGKGLAAHLSTAMVRTFQCSDRCRIERIEYARSTREASGNCGATSCPLWSGTRQ